MQSQASYSGEVKKGQLADFRYVIQQKTFITSFDVRKIQILIFTLSYFFFFLIEKI